jgi:hypothetical protein
MRVLWENFRLSNSQLLHHFRLLRFKESFHVITLAHATTENPLDNNSSEFILQDII